VTIRFWSGSPRSPKDSFSHLTLEFASGQIVLGMNARDSFSAINVRITPGLVWHDIRKSQNHLLGITTSWRMNRGQNQRGVSRRPRARRARKQAAQVAVPSNRPHGSGKVEIRRPEHHKLVARGQGRLQNIEATT
jgi:hypothetical protein